MTVVLVQPPPRVDMVEIVQEPSGKLRGRITRPWQLYFDDFFARAGGNVAPDNNELASMIDSVALGVFERPAEPPIRGDGGITVQPGNLLSIDMGYVNSFAQRRSIPVIPPNDSQVVLSGRIFGKH